MSRAVLQQKPVVASRFQSRISTTWISDFSRIGFVLMRAIHAESKAAVNRPQSRRFAKFGAPPAVAKRLECGCFSTALGESQQGRKLGLSRRFATLEEKINKLRQERNRDMPRLRR